MKKQTLVFLIGFFECIGIETTAQNLQWAIGMGGTGADAGQSLYIDPAGNVYMTGRFVSTADFDPTPGVFNLTSNGIGDIFLAKYDADGDLVWAHRFGGNLSDVGLGICGDPAGNVIVTGHFSGTADFDPGPGVANLASAGSADIFVAKYDPAGNLMWANSIGGPGEDFSYDVENDAAGDIALTGFFNGTVDFDPGPGVFNLTSNGGQDTYLARYDANGNFLWANGLGGSGDESGHALELDASGNIIFTGLFQNTVDFDPGPGAANLVSAGNADIFLAKYDAAGNYLWAIGTGDFSFDEGNSLAVDGAGNIFLTGTFLGTADFDPGPGTAVLNTAGGYDIFLARYDPLGNYAWAKAMGGAGADQGYSVGLGACGGVYVTGYFNGTADFDPGPGTAFLTAAGGLELFFARYEASGNYTWAHQIGGTDDDFGLHLEVAAGFVYLTGYFQNTADFDTGAGSTILTSAGSRDVFLAKYDVAEVIEVYVTDTICSGLSYYVGNFTYSTTGQYTAMLHTPSGCDSIIYLDLTVLPPIEHYVTDTICSGISYYLGNFTYSSTGQYQALLHTPEGCDSIVHLELTVLPPIERDLSDTTCSGLSYYLGNFTYSETGQYTAILHTPEGCDSIIHLDLTVLPPIQTDLTVTICAGQTFPVGNSNYGATGTYQNFLVSPEGCDSIVNLDLTVVPASTQTDVTASICEGQTYTVGDSAFASGGFYQVVLGSVNGCDSIINLNLNVLSHSQTDLAATICDGQTYTVGDSVYAASGVYQNVLAAANGCDSIVNLNLDVLPAIQTNLIASICDGQTYTVGNSAYTASGNYQNVLAAANGCDSIVNLNLTVLLPIQTDLNAAICDGQTYTLGDSVYTASGIYQNVFASANGCDSIVNLILNILPPVQTDLNATVCDGQAYTVGDSIYVVSGIYQNILASVNGCDSIINLTLNVLPSIQTDISANICDGQSYSLGDSVYTLGGTYQNTFTSANGCDSIVVLDLSVEPAFSLTPQVIQPVCPGETGDLTVGINGGSAPYLFALDNGQYQEQATFIGLSPGAYTLWVEDAAGCTATAEAIVEPPPALTLSFPEPVISIVAGENALLEPFANFQIDSLVWLPDSNLSCTDCLRPIASPVQTTHYQLIAYSDEGCELTASVQVAVHVIRRVYIPNVFNPANDGLGNIFTLFGDEQVEQILQMKIFDRWGNELFSAEGLTPGDPGSGWDGRYKGKYMLPGVYVYYFEVLFSDGVRHTFSGDVTLVR